MSEPFVAEIRIFPFNFAPLGWAFCDGQLLSISQNTALFSLVGTFYGGDGMSTFGLPNLQGSVPIHVGGNQPGPGLSTYNLGESGGSDTVTLLQSEMPQHNHALNAVVNAALVKLPDPTEALARSRGGNIYQSSGTTAAQMASVALPPAGSGFPHTNLMPYLTLNFCIALQGVFPARS